MKRKDLTNVTDAEARKTALMVAVVLVLAAAFLWYRGRTTAAVIAVSIAAVLTLTGILMPPLAKAFHRGWMRLAFLLGYVNSRILLTLIYVLVFVPYRLVSRLFGRDPLGLRGAPQDSYWHRRPVTRQAKEQFERLF
jgi:hypothetical protein